MKDDDTTTWYMEALAMLDGRRFSSICRSSSHTQIGYMDVERGVGARPPAHLLRYLRCRTTGTVPPNQLDARWQLGTLYRNKVISSIHPVSPSPVQSEKHPSSRIMSEGVEFSRQSSLSIHRADAGGEDGHEDDMSSSQAIPLRIQILQVVRASPNCTIRPARLAQELGISLTDASAELCGLLQAVGEGSSFSFEKTSDGRVPTMVFTFPPDFERKALAKQRKEDWKQTLKSILKFVIKFLKVLTAFGLILSTLIVSIAGMMALLAAFVALSRGGDRRQTHYISRQLHDVFIMVRQLLWCYAMFAPEGNSQQQDPFFREAAYDTSLVLSVCCGNPMSFWFWMRASHLRQRRRRIAQGWGRVTSDYSESPHDLEGVSLIRRGAWGQDEVLPVPRGSEDHRGLLSLAVEFLFGPEKPPSPLDADRWRLRGVVILERSQGSKTSSVSLRELSPYLDSPPASLNDVSKIVSEGLLVVAHFSGVPAPKSDDTPGDPKKDASSSSAEALFIFPELLGESHMTISRYDDVQCIQKASMALEKQPHRWKDLFWRTQEDTGHSSPASSTLTTGTPPFLHEDKMVFTSLSSKDFFRCLLVAVLNFLGVLWFAQSLVLGGILEGFLPPQVTIGLQWALIPILLFYAKLFFVIPAIRLSYLFIWNEMCMWRNRRRYRLASELQALVD